MKTKTVPVDLIDWGKFDLRGMKDAPKESTEELAASINAVGMLSPPVVFEKDGRFEVVAGNQRVSAVKVNLPEMVEIEVNVISSEEAESIGWAIVAGENFRRTALTPLQTARMMDLMIHDGYTLQKIRDQWGFKKINSVYGIIKLLYLEPEVQTLIDQGELDHGMAKPLTRFVVSKDAPKSEREAARKFQLDALKAIDVERERNRTEKRNAKKGHKATARQVEDICRKLRPSRLDSVQQEIADLFLPAIVSRRKSGLNIRMSFSSVGELLIHCQDIVDKIKGQATPGAIVPTEDAAPFPGLVHTTMIDGQENIKGQIASTHTLGIGDENDAAQPAKAARAKNRRIDKGAPSKVGKGRTTVEDMVIGPTTAKNPEEGGNTQLSGLPNE